MSQQSQIRFTRQIAALIAIMIPFYMIGFLWIGYPLLTKILVGCEIGYLLVLGISYSRWASYSRDAIVFQVNFGIWLFSLATGPQSGIDFLFFTFSIVPFLVFDPNERKRIIRGLILSGALFLLHIGFPGFPRVFEPFTLSQQIALRPALVAGAGIVHFVLILLVFQQATRRGTYLEGLIAKLVDREARLIHSARLTALGEMSVGLTHELKNPLTSILMSSQLAARFAGTATPPELTQSMTRIQKDVSRIQCIISGISKAGRHAEKDSFGRIELNRILLETQELCRGRLLSGDVTLQIDCKPPITIECREAEIVQILVNLINNSLDAVEKYSERWIRVETVVEYEHAIISVTDSGPGISAENAARIMDPFFTTKPSGKGTGIGLSISKRIALEHQGDLSLASASPHTCLILRLPLRQKILASV